jgi:hypothetical protein
MAQHVLSESGPVRLMLQGAKGINDVIVAS